MKRGLDVVVRLQIAEEVFAKKALVKKIIDRLHRKIYRLQSPGVVLKLVEWNPRGP